jgi:hypothetical protein
VSKIKAVDASVGGKHIRYEIGKEYNGLELKEIRDLSNEWEQNAILEYCGYTEIGNGRGESVFSVANCPMHVEYSPDGNPPGESQGEGDQP